MSNIPLKLLYGADIAPMVHQNHSGETRCERLVREALTSARLPFTQEAEIGPFHVDFLVGGRICIEVDGYIHMAQNIRSRDTLKDLRLADLGHTVMRIADCDARVPRDLKAFVESVRDQLRREQALVSPTQASAPKALDRPDLAALKRHLVDAERAVAEAPPSDEQLFQAAVAKLGPAPKGKDKGRRRG